MNLNHVRTATQVSALAGALALSACTLTSPAELTLSEDETTDDATQATSQSIFIEQQEFGTTSYVLNDAVRTDTTVVDQGSQGLERAQCHQDQAVSDADEENVASVMQSFGWGTACRAACWTAAGMGCGAISVACTGVTVITIGGTSIPCSLAIIAGCGAVGGGASVCSDKCPS